MRSVGGEPRRTAPSGCVEDVEAEVASVQEPSTRRRVPARIPRGAIPMRSSLRPRHHRARRLLGPVALALVVFATLGATPAGAAVAVHLAEPLAGGDTVCEPGHEWASVPSSNWQPKVTHADRYEHYTGGSGSYTVSAEEQTKVVAGLTYTTQAS